MAEYKAPLVSIILPAYNVGKYLKKAIDSILQQTFTDFEFIIINDGSTDDTEKVVQSYTDSRIIFLENEANRGLIYTLNRGILEATGKYIARMDGDDVCLPDRLQKQFDWLERNKQVDVLATRVTLIDEEDKEIGFWNEDIKYSSIDSIKKYLPVNNCIAHPTIMCKKEVLLTYKYDPSQKLSEDYDLWLRLAAGGKVIDKLPERLLRHRILQTSFTRTRNINVFFKILLVKWLFIKNQVAAGRFNTFIFLTFFYSFRDAIKGTGKMVKGFFIR